MASAKIREFIAQLFERHQPAQRTDLAILAGIGGFAAIISLYYLATLTGNPLLMAPFGASCVLLFSLPQSPLSQPANVIGGHLVSSAIGLSLHMVLPVAGWSVALAVGLAIAVMMILRVTHPPAGADPLVVFFDSPNWLYLGMPVSAGAIILVLVATVYHRCITKKIYPLKVI